MDPNEGYCYRHVLQIDAAKQSLVSYLARHFSHSLKSEWEDRLRQGEILLNDRVADGSEPLVARQVLLWNRPGWLEPPTPQAYSVVYQDQNILAVNKPSGLPTIPGGGYYANTLVRLVQVDFPEANPVHRLGRATSGLVLFALNPQAASHLGKRWQTFGKQYQALAKGIAQQDEYDIQSPIGDHAHSKLGWVFAANPDGKKSRSVARVLQRQEIATLFEVDLHTGRPHQIRIHLAFIGHPLVGDPLYDMGGVPKKENPGLPGDPGYHLHAKRLDFDHPVTGTRLRLDAPIPEILRKRAT